MEWLLAILAGLLWSPAESTSSQCASCHPDVTRQFAASRHAVAWTNPLFVGEYQPSPKPWCVRCHAPQVAADDRLAPPPRGAKEGVSCLACHQQGGHFVSRRRLPDSIHTTLEMPSSGSASDCARCHQFNFPILNGQGFLIGTTNEPMQNTVAETLKHLGAGARCTNCHDPHRASGSHSVSMVAAALGVHLCRRGYGQKSSIEMRITNRGAGHNVPTGGVHRFIAVQLWKSSAPAQMASLRLGRKFERPHTINSDSVTDSRPPVTTVDTTIGPGDHQTLVVVVNQLGGSPSEPINAEVRYHYSLSSALQLTDGTPAERRIYLQRIQFSKLSRCQTKHLRYQKQPSRQQLTH